MPNTVFCRLKRDRKGKLNRTQPSRNKPTNRLFFLFSGVIDRISIVFKEVYGPIQTIRGQYRIFHDKCQFDGLPIGCPILKAIGTKRLLW